MSNNQLIDILENLLLTPSSDFYISTILYNPNGSALDPRTIDDVDLGTLTVRDIPIGVIIRNLNVRGLSNTQVKFDGQGNPDIKVDGSTVTFHAKQPNTQEGYSRPPQVPAQILANGELDVSIAGSAMPPGTISLVVNSVAELTGTFSATEQVGGQSDTATITFTALSVKPDIGGGNIDIQIHLDTAFQGTINYVLNLASTQQQIIDQVNAKLNGADILSQLSDVATQQARTALGNM